MTTPPLNVEVHPVREVSLQGTADLEFWTEHLHGEELRPTDHDGRAQIFVITGDARWMGVRFRELSVSVRVSTSNGVYLPQAFNSSRLFAFMERRCLHTPYHHARVELSVEGAPSFLVVTPGGARFGARMSPDTLANLVTTESHDWEAPIFLPRRRPRAPGEVFFGRVGGPARTGPFGDDDSLTLNPAPDAPVIEALIDSGFEGEEWTIREHGTHARSKTVRRSRPRCS